jgi:hypothetical protein
MALSTFTVQREHDKFVENSDGDTAVRVVNDNLNEFGELPIVLGSHISTDNSTTTVLDADEVFTGTTEDITDAAIIIVSLKASHASATSGLSIQFSPDGINWDNDDSYTIPAATGKTFSAQPAGKYMRIVYTNGGTLQTYFRLQTIVKHGNTKPSSHRVQASIIDDDDAELVMAVPKLRTAQDNYVSGSATNAGNYKISLEEYNGNVALYGLPVRDWYTEVVAGNVTGASSVNKFGAAPDFDTGDGEVTIWDGAEDGTTWENMVYDYSATANIQYISSNNAGDTQTIELQGLDANYDLVVQTKALTGQTSATLDTPLIRIFRMKNTSSTNLAGHVFVSTTTAPAGGVPTAANIRAIIHPENNQTEMAIYTVPDGYSAYINRIYADTAGASRTAEYLIKLRAKPFGQVFQLKHKAVMSDSGSGRIIDRDFRNPMKFSAKTDIEMTAEILTGSITGANLIAGFDLVLVAD